MSIKSVTLTKDYIDTIAVPTHGQTLSPSDSRLPGFKVRATQGGSKAFVLEWRNGPDKGRETIGLCSEMSVEDALKDARLKKRRLGLGYDLRRDAPAPANAGGRTMTDLCNLFVEVKFPRYSKNTKDGWGGRITNEIMPALGKMNVSDISYADVQRLFDTVTKRSPSVADHMRQCLSAMFKLAITEKWRPDNPCAEVKLNMPPPRERVLTDDEWRRMLNTLEASPTHKRVPVNILKLLMATGCRKMEVVGMQWSELNLATGVWTIPAARMKQRRNTTIRLNTYAIELLTMIRDDDQRGVSSGVFARFGLAAECDYVFPNTLRSDHFPANTLWNFWLGVRVDAHIPDITIHDVRRSFISRLADEGKPISAIGKAIGQKRLETTLRYVNIQDTKTAAISESMSDLLRAGPRSSGDGVGLSGKFKESDERAKRTNCETSHEGSSVKGVQGVLF